MSATSVSYSQTPTGADAPAADPTKDINAQNTNPNAPNGERPTWLPEQFNDGEALAKSFTDTQAELTRAKQELATLKKEAPAADGDKPAEGDDKGLKIENQTDAEKAAADAVAKAGLDVTPWQEEFNSTRDVSEEGRAKIAEGLKDIFGDNARSVVDDFIEGQRMRLDNLEGQIHTTAGGKDQYQQMVGWAATNLKPNEIAAYDAAMDSNDINTMTLAVDGLRARFERENGSSPQLLNGDNAIHNANAGFASTHEMTKAMADPRYKADPVYRKSVEQRAMKSNF